MLFTVWCTTANLTDDAYSGLPQENPCAPHCARLTMLGFAGVPPPPPPPPLPPLLLLDGLWAGGACGHRHARGQEERAEPEHREPLSPAQMARRSPTQRERDEQRDEGHERAAVEPAVGPVERSDDTGQRAGRTLGRRSAAVDDRRDADVGRGAVVDRDADRGRVVADPHGLGRVLARRCRLGGGRRVLGPGVGRDVARVERGRGRPRPVGRREPRR